VKAIILNLLAWIILPVMDGFAKYLSADMPVLQITWARYFFTVVFTLPVMMIFYRKHLVWTDKPKLQLIRGLILLTANICFFLCHISYFFSKGFNFSICCPFNSHSFFSFFPR